MTTYRVESDALGRCPARTLYYSEPLTSIRHVYWSCLIEKQATPETYPH